MPFTARYLFGEARTVYCHTTRVHPDIKGEDVATVMMETRGGATVLCSLSYASRVEHDRFNETTMFIECENGSVELGPDYWVRVTTENGTLARRCVPPRYTWADPTYAAIHPSIVSCNGDLLRALQTNQQAATSGEDNLETMHLVFGAYESTRTGRVIRL